MRNIFLATLDVAAVGSLLIYHKTLGKYGNNSAIIPIFAKRIIRFVNRQVNGSPRTDGNTFCCLKEIEATLNKHGVESEIVQIGRKPVRMCINCGGCRQNNGAGCAFDDDMCSVITEKMKDADALIVGTPVYYGQPNGGILSLMQRLFFSAGHLVQNKPAAALAVCRRGGATATLQTMNMMFEMMNMPVVTSQYWNIAYGAGKGEVKLDTEGMQTMRTLATTAVTPPRLPQAWEPEALLLPAD